MQVATRAVENDSAPAIAARWQARLRRDPADREALLGLATIRRLTYRYQAAESTYTRLLVPAAPGREDPFAIQSRLGQSYALLTRGRLAEAVVQLQRAVEESRAARDSLSEGEALVALAGAVARIRGGAAAESLLTRAETLVRGGGPAFEARLRCTRAVLNSVLGGSPADAERGAAEGAELARRAGEPRLTATCLFARMGAGMRRGVTGPAVFYLADTIQRLQQSARDRAARAATLQWTGYYFSALGQYGYAWQRLQEAVVEAEASGNESVVAWASGNLASVALYAGDLELGRSLAARSESLHTTRGDQIGLAGAAGLRGDIARAAGDWPAAQAAYTKGLADSARFGNPNRQLNLRHGLAQVAMDEGDVPRAERELIEARRIAREHKLTGWEQGLTGAFARLALRRGELAEAERLLGERLKTERYLRRYQARTMLAEVHTRRGDFGLAEAELIAAGDELDTWRSHLGPVELRAAAFEFGDVDMDLSLSRLLAGLVAQGRTGPAFALAERQRGRLLLDRLLRADAFRAAQPGETTAVRPLRIRPTVDLAAVQAALPDDRTALLQYLAGRRDEPTLVFVITKQGGAAHIIAPVDSLQEEVARFAGVIESGGSARTPGRVLGAALLDAAVRGLPPQVTRLIVVPDDILHRVPFDALMLADGRMAVERFGISMVPSASIAVRLWAETPPGSPGRVLALADPVFATEPASAVAVFSANGGLGRLRGSGREARSVARLAGPADVRTRGAASEAFLKRSRLREYSVIHLATHAVADERGLTRTALALAPGDGEDGFLGPGDVASLDLAADLVILSACRTAGGPVVRGEGILGLMAPLLQAGARSVVATQWRIDDRGTARFMEELYRALGSGLPAGDALHQAKLAARRRGEPAARWAAFTLFGDPFARVRLGPGR